MSHEYQNLNDSTRNRQFVVANDLPSLDSNSDFNSRSLHNDDEHNFSNLDEKNGIDRFATNLAPPRNSSKLKEVNTKWTIRLIIVAAILSIGLIIIIAPVLVVRKDRENGNGLLVVQNISGSSSISSLPSLSSASILPTATTSSNDSAQSMAQSQTAIITSPSSLKALQSLSMVRITTLGTPSSSILITSSTAAPTPPPQTTPYLK